VGKKEKVLSTSLECRLSPGFLPGVENRVFSLLGLTKPGARPPRPESTPVLHYVAPCHHVYMSAARIRVAGPTCQTPRSNKPGSLHFPHSPFLPNPSGDRQRPAGIVQAAAGGRRTGGGGRRTDAVSGSNPRLTVGHSGQAYTIDATVSSCLNFLVSVICLSW
jgi:hypothetical protein